MSKVGPVFRLAELGTSDQISRHVSQHFGVIVPISSVIRSCISATNATGSLNTRFFREAHKKKSGWDKSGLRDGHSGAYLMEMIRS